MGTDGFMYCFGGECFGESGFEVEGALKTRIFVFWHGFGGWI